MINFFMISSLRANSWMLLTLLLAAHAGPCNAWDDRPTGTGPLHKLAEGPVRAWISLPGDGESGFYAGRRFETAGSVAFLQYRGWNFVGWGAPVEGGLTLGLVGEFLDLIELPGRAERVKIGVGRVSGSSPADFAVTERYGWRAYPREAGVDLEQVVREPEGVGYRLRKRIEVMTGGLEIGYELENTGQSELHTRHYGHNFMVPGGMAGGVGMEVDFGIEIAPRAKVLKMENGAAVEGSRLVFHPREHYDQGSTRIDLEGEDLPRRVVLANRHNGAAVAVETDWTPRFYRLYVTWREVCPEPYYDVRLAPREKAAWRTRYDFTVQDPSGHADRPTAP